MLPFVLILMSAVPSHAEWVRKGYSGKGTWTDKPQPHSLSHFTRDPFLRDDANDFCTYCTQADKATIHLKMKVRSEVRRVGVLAGLSIFDALYYFEGNDVPNWKFVLVKTGTDQYREIFHVQRTGHEQFIGPSSIVTFGKEKVLSTLASVGGKSEDYGHYFWFDEHGPVIVDVYRTIRQQSLRLLPRGARIGRQEVDLQRLTVKLSVFGKNDLSCCTGGTVMMKFKLERGRFVVTDARYIRPPSR